MDKSMTATSYSIERREESHWFLRENGKKEGTNWSRRLNTINHKGKEL